MKTLIISPVFLVAHSKAGATHSVPVGEGQQEEDQKHVLQRSLGTGSVRYPAQICAVWRQVELLGVALHISQRLSGLQIRQFGQQLAHARKDLIADAVHFLLIF